MTNSRDGSGGDSTDEPLVRVQNLEKHYYEADTIVDKLLGNEPTVVRAVDGVSFDIRRGETLGLVGESGCGKSTTGETLLRLREPTAGRVEFDGMPVFDLDDDGEREFRRRAAMMFQDPFSSLNPRMTVGGIVREPMKIHGVGTREERDERTCELLERVGLSADHVDRYPHEFSGGQRQRIGIARTLALDPDFVVLDEPVSALDVSVQAQVLNLLSDLQEELGLTYLFIAHDLSVVRHISDRVVVMYLGRIAEVGPTERIFETPGHPYTEALLDSVPQADLAERDREVTTLPGEFPSPRDPPSGCRFRTRCPALIPPERVELPQDQWRSLATLRHDLESGRFDPLALVVHGSGTDDEDGGEQPPVGETRPADAGELLAELPANTIDRTLRERYGLPERLDDPRVEEIFAETSRVLSRGSLEDAPEVMASQLSSVCEREEPDSHVVGDEQHIAACHLRRS